MIGNFTEVKPLQYWVQHILPLVYDDSLSYMELLGKVINTLNEIVKNNNAMPEYIMELIKDYISSGEIEKVLAEVLANYMLNVKFPPAGLKPATGDGSADDTEAIQGCIDYAYNNGGMSVYFPSGSYLTQPLTLRDKATLFGQDRYTTRLIMKGGATTAMFTGDVDELTLTGLGFDGNMDIQVNNVNLFTISVNSAIITNCLLTDGYDLLNITVNDDLQLNDVIFRHAVENALVLKGEGIVQGNNLIFKSVSELVGKNFVVMDVSKSILEQLKCYGASPNAVLINGSNNVVKMWNEQSLKAYTDNGVNNTVVVYTQSEQKKLTGSKTTNVNGDLTETIGGNKTESITGNKGVSVHNLTETVLGDYSKTVTGSISEIANSFKTDIQLTYELIANRLTEQLTNKEVNTTNSTENLGNKTETITGKKEVTANTSTENIANEKHVIAGSVTEDITGDKHVNAANSVETVQGDKTITAGDISETTVNKTVHITKDIKEQVDGTRTLTVTGVNNETTGARTETVNGNKTTTITDNKTETIGGNSTETVDGNKNIIAENVHAQAQIFDIDAKIKYSNPTPVNSFYSNLPLTNREDDNYNVMVATAQTESIITNLLDSLEKSTQVNKSLLDKLKTGANVYMVGDSIGEGWGWWGKQGIPKTNDNDGFFALMRPVFPNTNFINVAVGGAHFNHTITDNTVQSQLNNVKNADVVFLLAGINDITLTIENNVDYLGVIKNNVNDDGFTDFDISKTFGAMENVIKTIYEQNPDAYVCYILTGTTGTIDLDVYYGIYNNYIDICNKWGVSVFNCVNHIGSYPNLQARKYYSDYFHYNEEGYRKLTPYLIKALLTQTNENNYIGKSIRTFSDDVDGMVSEMVKRMGLWNNTIFTTLNRLRTNTSKWLPAMMWGEGKIKIVWCFDIDKGIIYNKAFTRNAGIFKSSSILTGQKDWYGTPPTSMLDLMPNGITIVPNGYLANLKGLPNELKTASTSSGDLMVISIEKGNARHVFCMLAFGDELYHGIIPKSGNSIFRKISGFTKVEGSPVS